MIRRVGIFFCKPLRGVESNILVMADRTCDESLIERYNGGDDAAFDAIVMRHGADVASLANRLLGWPGSGGVSVGFDGPAEVSRAKQSEIMALCNNNKQVSHVSPAAFTAGKKAQIGTGAKG